ncbi:MAG: dTDP-4-dehydrorhamnose 3,5-epimerase [Verrucomicrobiota bacterium]|nr:dTDP-4-dehydrorhamnose 3,5-epimerase [Verrucomicrobiota bacterium]
MQVISLRIDGLKKISPRFFEDERGFFLESYQERNYREAGIELAFVQDNIAFSKEGTLRGLHFQSSPGQAKLVSCLQGKVWDVAVDLRPESSTFGQWEACFLDGEKKEQFFIPAGFAHGYLALSKTATVHYKVSTLYDPSAERAIRWNDPDLAIPWGIENPRLSEKDRNAPFYKEMLSCLCG